MLEASTKHDQYIWARAPVRLDLAGGWSDTPPYTFRHGGKVVNMAVNLNGQVPVQVYVRRDREPRIKLQSIDTGLSEIISSLEQIENHRDPRIPFANAKAALHLLGVNRLNLGSKQSLKKFLLEIGGGFDVTTFVAVPKGSGLGVSSILGATLLKALYALFGRERQSSDLLNDTLRLEQMFTSGGGWQDQAGGMIGGIKYFESQSCPEGSSAVSLDTEYLDSHVFEESESRQCFTLYYTGITRLAKNVLQHVVQRVSKGDQEYLDLHDHIKNLAERAKRDITRRNIFSLGETIRHSWEANKNIHFSATNSHIDELLKKVKPYYIGAKLLGAGGGGYCLFVSESPDQARKLRAKLYGLSTGTARLVDWSLNTSGLQLSLS